VALNAVLQKKASAGAVNTAATATATVVIPATGIQTEETSKQASADVQSTQSTPHSEVTLCEDTLLETQNNTSNTSSSDSIPSRATGNVSHMILMGAALSVDCLGETSSSFPRHKLNCDEVLCLHSLHDETLATKFEISESIASAELGVTAMGKYGLAGLPIPPRCRNIDVSRTVPGHNINKWILSDQAISVILNAALSSASSASSSPEVNGSVASSTEVKGSVTSSELLKDITPLELISSQGGLDLSYECIGVGGGGGGMGVSDGGDDDVGVFVGSNVGMDIMEEDSSGDEDGAM
jgi:hypothetical protein